MLFNKTFLVLAVVFISLFSQAQQQIETYFNLPGFGGEPSLTIENQIIQLLREAGPTTKVNVSLYTFSRKPVALEMLQAQARGASIELVMDDKYKDQVKQSGTALNMIEYGADGLPGLKCDGQSCLKFCKGGCLGSHINHNKFFLFSKLNDSEFIVAQTSANMTDGQLKNYNDLVVIKHDKAFYDGMIEYWKTLKKSSGKTETIEGQNGIKSYFFPRLTGSDPVEKLLNQVRCDSPGSLIRVIQSRFDDHRDYLAARMAVLAKEGCDVKVIVREEPDKNSPGKKVVKLLGQNIAVLPYKGAGDEDKELNSIHSKVLLIQARIDKSNEKETIVMTGSHNYNLTSLRTNDEALFKIKDSKTFEDYLNYWNRLAKDSGVFQ